jgi:hypothetical protein
VDHRIGPPLVSLGPSLRVLHEDDGGVEVAGGLRLRPGYRIRIDRGDGTGEREALVWTWRLVRLGRGGTDYRGYCRWT